MKPAVFLQCTAVIVCCSLTPACSHLLPVPANDPQAEFSYSASEEENALVEQILSGRDPGAADDAAPADMLSLLYGQYSNWEGTRYRLGGLSKKGVDCSGLVYLTYRDLFGVELPRSTADQVHRGKPIDKRSLQAGDLVFFRTGSTGRHVGIYMEDNRFLHASASGGVTISAMNEPYWRKHFWQARRISQP